MSQIRIIKAIKRSLPYRILVCLIVLVGYIDCLLSLGLSVIVGLSGYYILAWLIIVRAFITNPITHRGLVESTFLNNITLLIINLSLGILIVYLLSKSIG